MRLSMAWAHLAVGLALVAAAAVTASGWLFAVVIGLSAAAIALGARINRPRHPLLWLSIAAAIGVWSITIGASWSPVLYSHTTFSTFLVTRVPSYVLMLAAVIVVLYRTGRVPLGRTDATIAMIGVCTVLWPIALEPNLSPLTALSATSIGVVVVDLSVLTLLLRVAFTPSLDAAAFRMVLASGAAFTVGDLANVSPEIGSRATTHLVFAFYALACVLVATAALHPTMREIPLPAAARPPDPSSRRTTAVLSTALIAPFAGMMLNKWVEHETDPYVFGTLGLLLVLGALVKIIRILRRLETSEQRFRMMFDSSGIGISLGAGGMLSETNDAYQRLLGYTGEELAAMHYNDVLHPEDVGLDTELAAEVAAGKRSSYSMEKRYVRRDGEVRWVNVTVTMARDRTFGIGMTEDITERHRLEEERQRLLARSVEVAEAERTSLAADLHDGPIQHLTAVTLTLDLLGNKLGRGDVDGAKALAHQLRDAIAEEMRSLRRLMTELRPPILDERGLEATLRDCAEATLAGEVAFSLDYGLNGSRLAPELETVIYRVVREALTNIHKHAHAQAARVSIAACAGRVELDVADDGAGFAAGAQNGDHVGVLTMQERVESVGGTWLLQASPGEGTRIRAVLPQKLRALDPAPA